jgi:hypothetical protein
MSFPYHVNENLICNAIDEFFLSSKCYDFGHLAKSLPLLCLKYVFTNTKMVLFSFALF